MGSKVSFWQIIDDYTNITWLVVSMKQRIICQFPYELGMEKKNSDMSYCYWNARTGSTKEPICSQNYLRTRNMSYSTKSTKETWSDAESSQIGHLHIRICWWVTWWLSCTSVTTGRSYVAFTFSRIWPKMGIEKQYNINTLSHVKSCVNN